MFRSMTGFGQAARSADGFRVEVELKSVNHRYSEIVVRLPREWSSSEDGIKKEIQRVVRRGRVDAFIAIERETGGARTVEVDWTLARGYAEAAESLKEKLGLADSGPITVRDMLTLPELLVLRESEADPERIREPLLACVREAADRLRLMRETEGAHLAKELSERLDRLETLRSEAAVWAPKAVEDYRAKLRQRIAELLGDASAPSADDPRLAMEVAVLADRCDIGEELTRLSSHIVQCRSLLDSEEPAGRKLDFLLQEMNREANTIGSKSNHLELVNRVVDMKAELEKMREQAQNIE